VLPYLAVKGRVIKLGDFSPIGRLFILSSFLKISEVAHILLLLFSAENIVH
jgi:hypothetical protein